MHHWGLSGMLRLMLEPLQELDSAGLMQELPKGAMGICDAPGSGKTTVPLGATAEAMIRSARRDGDIVAADALGVLPIDKPR